MAKGFTEVLYDRSKFGTLAAANADGNLTPNAPATVIIAPPSVDYAVVPTAIFAQSQMNVTFSLTLSIAGIWNTAPSRRVRVSRLDEDDREVVGVDYALPQVGPKSAILQLDGLEVAALQSNVLRGKKLVVALDGIEANEWQAVYCVYKFITANDELRV